MTQYRVDLATLRHVSQISWPSRIYRFVLLFQQLWYVILTTLLADPLPVALAAHETDKAPHSNPKSKFISSRLLELNWRIAPAWSQILSSIFSWVHIQWLLSSLGCLTGYMTSESRPLQCLIWHIKACILTEGTVTCTLLAKMALMKLLKLPFRMIKELLYTLEDLMFCTAVDKDAIRVPTFYASSNKSHEDLWMIWTIIVALLFGGIHCAGWNFPFPSHAELII